MAAWSLWLFQSNSNHSTPFKVWWPSISNLNRAQRFDINNLIVPTVNRLLTARVDAGFTNVACTLRVKYCNCAFHLGSSPKGLGADSVRWGKTLSLWSRNELPEAGKRTGNMVGAGTVRGVGRRGGGGWDEGRARCYHVLVPGEPGLYPTCNNSQLFPG